MLTIKTKIILAYTIAYGILLAGFAMLIYRDSEEAKLSNLDIKLESHVEKLAKETEDQHDEGEFPNYDSFLEIRTEGLSRVKMQLVNLNGETVFGDSALENYPSNGWREAVKGKLQKNTITLLQAEYREIWFPADVDDEIKYVVRIAAPLNEMRAELDRLKWLLWIAIPTALGLAGFMAYFITRAAFKPISRMVETTRKITAANLDARLDLPKTQDEIRSLGETLNGLMERIDTAFAAQKQFVADASHEIRTPLAIIRSELEFALKQTKDEPAKNSIHISLSEIERLTRMSSQLLLLAKLDSAEQPLTRAKERLDELLLECIQFNQKFAAQKEISFDLFVEEAIEVQADGEKLKSVILNLLDNAVKYSPEKSIVTVSLRIKKEQHKSTAEITVADKGIGMTASDLSNLFKRFYRGEVSKSDSLGSGLGLSIAKRIIELHQGDLSVQSENGKGTQFTIQLPL